MPSVIINHEPQISSDHTIQLFETVTHLFVKIFITQVHDFHGKLATELS